MKRFASTINRPLFAAFTAFVLLTGLKLAALAAGWDGAPGETYNGPSATAEIKGAP